MLIKFIKAKGSTRQAVNYLLQEKDNKGVIRADIKVLRGNPKLIAEIGDSLKFKYKYSSAVIAWHKNDEPTPEQIDEVIDDFIKVAFAGLEK